MRREPEKKPALVTDAESERIKLLRQYAILDTPPEQSFDRVTTLAAKLLHVPVALISLIDTDRIWFKSAYGVNISQLPREAGLCATAILSDDIYIIEDVSQHPELLTNPMVTAAGLKFYASVPLKVNGYNLGTLCIVDKEPRQLTKEDEDTLLSLAGMITDHLELLLEVKLASHRQNQALGMLAHELKNPLAIIPSSAQLISEKYPGDREVSQICNHIEKAGKRMAALINETLEVAKLHTQEMRLNKSEFEISSVVGRVAAINTVLANAKEQKIFLDILDNIVIHADEMKISEVVDNLISNAIKYSPAGANITVRLECTDNKAMLQVIDEGPGLSDDDKEKLFQPFTRLSAKPTGGETSSGVGLSIVKLLAELHGGHVYAENNEDKGATFTVEIPAACGEEKAPQNNRQTITVG